MDNQELIERLSRAENLPSPPGVALRVIELGQDPNVSMGRVVKAVSADPALIAKILRVANSAYYGRRRKTENLRQAIVLLGLNGMLSLALSFSLVAGLRTLRGSGLDYDLFWRRSLAAATCARALGTHVQLRRREELFLAGLLQDIGMLALDKVVPGIYSQIGPLQVNHRHVQSVERESVGADHAMVGAWLLNRWNLPKAFQSAVECSHDPDAVDIDPEDRMFGRSVFVSGVVADIWFREDRELATQEAADLANEHLGVTRQELVSLLNSTAAEMRDNARIYDVAQADPRLTESILEQAKEILLVRTLQTMRTADELQKATETLESRTRELEERSRRDDLTSLYNRSYFKGLLTEELREAGKRRWPLTLIIIDLDHFKQVNDSYGHQSGDEVLKGAARVLEGCFRNTDICARYGGEEFSVLLPGTDLDGARIVCERLVAAFRATRHRIRNGKRIAITASIGIASLGEPESFDDIERFIEAADQALYAAKHAGRNRFAIHGVPIGGRPGSKVS